MTAGLQSINSLNVIMGVHWLTLWDVSQGNLKALKKQHITIKGESCIHLHVIKEFFTLLAKQPSPALNGRPLRQKVAGLCLPSNRKSKAIP